MSTERVATLPPIDALRTHLAHDTIGSTGSLPENIADVIERFIEAEALAAGTLMGTKAELAAVFSVAPSTLSEAMKILASRGSVRLRPGPRGGALVAEQRPVLRLARSMVRLNNGEANIPDIVDVRDALEGTVARDALEHRTTADIRNMRERLIEVENARDATEFYRAVLALHATIAEAGANEFLKLVYLTAVRTLSTRTQHFSPPRNEAAAAQLRRERTEIHRAIVNAIEARDSAALERVLTDHAGYR